MHEGSATGVQQYAGMHACTLWLMLYLAVRHTGRLVGGDGVAVLLGG